jgi:hypothetical protein
MKCHTGDTCAQVRALKQQANALADEAASEKFNVQSAQQEGDNLRGLIVEVSHPARPPLLPIASMHCLENPPCVGPQPESAAGLEHQF